MHAAKRILVADDSPTLVEMVRSTLEGAGYGVLTAPDGLAAMNVALRDVPDLVISDVEMPEMTGLQLCRLLKGDPRTSAVPFLILSSHKEQHEQFWGRETGADDYLPKPFDSGALLKRVRTLLERHPRPERPAVPIEVPAATRVEALERVNASLERRLFELTVVHGISEIAAITTGERDTVRAVLERVSRLVEFSAGGLAIAPGGASYLLIRRSIGPLALQRFHAQLLEALPAIGGSVPLPGLLSGAEFVSPSASNATPAVALQPFVAAGRVVGVVGVARDSDRPFEDPDRALLDLLADQAALILENARLAEAERQHLEAVKRHNLELEEKVAERTVELRQALQDLSSAHLDTMERLAIAAEFRDRDTARHIRRIGLYCEMMGKELGLPPAETHVLLHASPMHDVGKIGIPDQILLKPGKLTVEEWRTMTQHTTIGARILAGSPSPLLQAAETIAYSHHEKWNGTGYPRGLGSDEIPISSRICAVADVFDALVSRRPYKAPMPLGHACEILREGSGSHFEPRVVAAFLDNVDKAATVQHEHSDPAAPAA